MCATDLASALNKHFFYFISRRARGLYREGLGFRPLYLQELWKIKQTKRRYQEPCRGDSLCRPFCLHVPDLFQDFQWEEQSLHAHDQMPPCLRSIFRKTVLPAISSARLAVLLKSKKCIFTTIWRPHTSKGALSTTASSVPRHSMAESATQPICQ